MSRAVSGLLVLVEAQLTPEGIRWPLIAADLGVATVFLTNNLARYEKLPAFDTVFGRPDVSVVSTDTNSVDGIMAAVKGLSDADPVAGPVQGIYTQCDYNLPQVAETARRLGLPGLDPDAAWLARNKLLTRRAGQDAGVPAPRFAHATDVQEAQAIARDLGLPCVVKPMTESASTDVALCRDLPAVVRQFTSIAGEPRDRRGQPRVPGALIEEYCPGYEVSVETLTIDGVIHVLGVTDKSLSPHPYFAEIGHTFPSLLPEQITAELAGTAVAALRAIGHDFGAAHTEVRMSGAGPRLIEVNARLAGEEVPEMINAALGLSIRHQVLGMHLSIPVDLVIGERRGSSTRKFTFPVSGTLRRVEGLEDARQATGVADAFLMAAPGDAVHALTSNHELYGQVRTVADTPAEAQRLAEAAFNHVYYVID